MSLLYWWPFTENLVDKMQGKAFVANNYWTLQTKGQVGKCIGPHYTGVTPSNSGTTKVTQIYAPDVTIPDTFSVAVWVRNDGLGSPYTYCPIQFCNGDPYMQGANNKGWDFTHQSWRIVYNDGGEFYGGRDSGSGSQSSWGNSLGTPVGSWYHIAFTVNRVTATAELFIDGVSKGTSTIPAGLGAIGGTYQLRMNWVQGWLLNGAVNDLRIYDHVLSKAEIDELKRGLMLHYSFNSLMAESTTNLMPADKQNQVAINSSNAGSYSITSGLVNGGTYTLSGLYTRYPDDKTPGCRFSIQFNYTDGTMDHKNYHICEDGTDLYETSSADGVPHYFTLTYTANPSKQLSYINGWALDRDGYTGYARHVEVRNLQVERKDHATLYTPTTRESMMSNEAGYTNPYKLQNVNLSVDTTNGTKAGLFSSSAYTLIQTEMDLNGKTDLTVAAWVYTTGSGTLGSVAYYHIVNGSSLELYAYNRSDTWLKTTIPLNKWIHLAITYSATERKIYLNGKEVAKDTLTKPFDSRGRLDLGYDTSTNGRIFNGKIADYRVYATTLSAKEIGFLYNSKAMISKQGDILTSQFALHPTEIDITKQGIIKSKMFCDSLDDYDRLEYIESTGSQHIFTGVYSHENITGLRTHYYQTNYSPGQILFGAYDGTSTYYFCYKESSSVNLRSHWRYSNMTTDAPWTENMPVTASLTKNGNELSFSANGYTKNGSVAAAQTGSYNMALFAYNDRDAVAYYYYCRLYTFEIEVDNILVRSFIPVRRQSDGAVGLYDAVSKRFFGNSGTGSFIAGPTIAIGEATIHKKHIVSGRNLMEV